MAQLVAYTYDRCWRRCRRWWPPPRETYLQRTGFHRVGEYNKLTKNIIYKLSKEETYQYIEGFWKDNTLQVGIHKIRDNEHRDDHRTYHRSHVRNQIEQRTEKSNNQRILDPKDKQDNSKQDKDHT